MSEQGATDPRLRVIVKSDTTLATVLGVTRAAVYQAEHRDRIDREPDGTWEVLAVIKAWRSNTDFNLQRRVPAWLDPAREVTDAMRLLLARRARAAGGHVFEDEGNGRGWRPFPDIATQLREGRPLSHFADLELDAVVYEGPHWYGWSLSAAEELAGRLGMADVDAVRNALHATMREALAALAETNDDDA